jgi:hypothetical protein
MSSKTEPAERPRPSRVHIRDTIISHVTALGLAALFWAALIATYGLDLQPGFF